MHLRSKRPTGLIQTQQASACAPRFGFLPSPWVQLSPPPAGASPAPRTCPRALALAQCRILPCDGVRAPPPLPLLEASEPECELSLLMGFKGHWGACQQVGTNDHREQLVSPVTRLHRTPFLSPLPLLDLWRTVVQFRASLPLCDLRQVSDPCWTLCVLFCRIGLIIASASDGAVGPGEVTC